MQELKQGTSLQNGKYKIEKVLGKGSFGITYMASYKAIVEGPLGKMEAKVQVAIKEFFMSEINTRAVDSDTVEGSTGTVFMNYRKRFRREAENLSKLNHPNIVKVSDVFEENNTIYYVMQYIDEESLDEYITKKGRLQEKEALRIFKEIASALTYMHDRKVLHLDLKPKNVMLDKNGHVFIIDFGLSKQYTTDGEPESSTTIGLGTAGYAPIEQANSSNDKTFQATIDVYALGATLFKMLTGHRPDDASVILNQGFPREKLETIGVRKKTIDAIEEAMEPQRKRRYQSVNEFLKDIDVVKGENEETSFEDGEKTSDSKEEMSPDDKERIFSKKKIKILCLTILFICGVIVYFSLNVKKVENSLETNDSTVMVDSSKKDEITYDNKAINLGLPSGTLWANRNLGAKSEFEDGLHYAFGTLESKFEYPEKTGDEFKGGESIVGTQYDVVTAEWGKEWQLPSKEQVDELIRNCRFVVKKKGFEVIGPNGNSIFLPYTDGNGDSNYGYGYYWSGNKGYVLEFQPGYAKLNEETDAEMSDNFASNCGLSIRPVRANKINNQQSHNIR